MYHRIASDAFDPWGLTVGAERFEDQVNWLAQNRQVLPLIEFAERHRQGTLEADSVALTFDDGYACAATTALPLLAGAGAPATIFLPAALIESGREFWWDDLQRLVLAFPEEKLSMLGEELHVPPQDERDAEWPAGQPPRTGRQKLFHRLWSKLRLLPHSTIDEAITQVREQAATEHRPRESHRPLSGEEIRSMPEIIDFGAHALTHPSLPSLDSRDKAEEIGLSVEACTRLTGKRPRSFAYPYGDADPESAILVEIAGFECACSTRSAPVTPAADRFSLPRLQVGNWKLARFADMLGGE